MLAVDPATGEASDPQARALFTALPAVTPATSLEELVTLGLLAHLPAGLASAYERPKYVRGREVFVRAPADFGGVELGRPVGAYREGEPVAVTHRGVLRGRRGDAFVVELAGASAPLVVPQAELVALNEPVPVPTEGASSSGVLVDYAEPMLKAHLTAAFIALADELESLTYLASDDEVAKVQRRLLHALVSRVRMTYPGRGAGYAGPKAGALLSGGQAVCFAQRTAVAAYLQPFARLLALELQLAIGKTLRLGVLHGFLVVTLRPSWQRWVVDPAWGEPATELRVAFFDRGWGHDRRLVALAGEPSVAVRPSDIDLPEEAA